MSWSLEVSDANAMLDARQEAHRIVVTASGTRSSIAGSRSSPAIGVVNIQHLSKSL
jgi:hypothetical protein